MSDFKKFMNGAALAFSIGFWFSAGATLGVATVSGFLGMEIDYIMVVDTPAECEDGPCG